jgi:hypothetical protein
MAVKFIRVVMSSTLAIEQMDGLFCNEMGVIFVVVEQGEYLGECHAEQTTPTYYQNLHKEGNAYLLEDQPVMCPEAEVLTGFQMLVSSSLGFWRYHYRCCKATAILSQCRPSVGSVVGSQSNLADLAQAEALCDESALMQGFKLNTYGQEALQYEPTCCFFNEFSRCPADNPQCVADRGEDANLPMHIVVCLVESYASLAKKWEQETICMP